MYYKLDATNSCDVFVMGAGIAGVMAAIEAAKHESSVIIASSKQIFSGSSFYPGTWGLGLIGPKDEQDIESLTYSIKDVGCGVVNEKLVRTFVANINESIDYLKTLGVELKGANQASQKEFIPCFDYTHRHWNGILFKSAKEVLGKLLSDLGVKCLEQCHVVEFVKDKDKLIGVVVINRGTLQFIKCKSLVVASGGLGGLYRYRLNTSDVLGMGQALALKAGAKLVNIEFMQMMQGFIKPCPKTIFNEKVYRYLNCFDESGTSLFKGREDLLEIRSTHGPFTSRLASKEVDLKIYEAFLKNREGILCRYDERMKENKAEFIQTYFDWLEKEKGLSRQDEFYMGIFYHASNGGIAINELTETGVAGLFACGEATGGMHGADRIGGLSTANGLVFGRIAGQQSSIYAQTQTLSETQTITLNVVQYEEASKQIEAIRELMFTHAFVSKNEHTLTKALQTLQNIRENLIETRDIQGETLIDSYVLNAHLLLAQKLLTVMLKRRESRGSHYRSDYPTPRLDFNDMIYVEEE